MRHAVSILVVALAVSAPVSAQTQPARVGRLPILELPAAGAGSCQTQGAGAFRMVGIARMIIYQTKDSSHVISLGVNAKGVPIVLMAAMGTDSARRGESESVQVSFDSTGAIANGRRRAFTSGTPAHLGDDKQVDLLPGDTAAIKRLTTAIRQRCRG